MTVSFEIQSIQPNIGAIISGVDLNQLSEEQVGLIHQALLKHQVIFFRNQKLEPQAQAELARSFGDLHIHPIYPTVEGVKEIIVLDSHRQDLRDNELWHTDVTFSQTPPLGCVLQAIKIPEVGGDTLWASGVSAFRLLDEKLKEKLRNLTAEHDIRKSFPLERFASTPEEKEKLEATFRKNPPVTHPVIRTHPETGEESLFVSEGFTTKIHELDEAESHKLLEFLFKYTTQADFHVRWQWKEGDVAIWDNRCTQHKALFDYGDAHRIMRRATVLGDVPYYQQAAS